MQFNLYATFRLLAGTRSLELDLPAGTTVRQALNAVIEQYPKLKQHWLNEEGEVHAHVHIFVNGDDVQNLKEGMETQLPENSVLDFFPPVAGGCR